MQLCIDCCARTFFHPDFDSFWSTTVETRGPRSGKHNKTKNSQTKDESGVSSTPHIDEYLEQLSLDSTERLTPPEYDSNGYFTREHFV